MPLPQNTPRILQAAFGEVTTVGPQQSFCIIFPPQTMGLLALADSSGSWAEDSHLACLLALQTLLDQVAPRLSDASLVNDDAYLVLLKDGTQQVHKALCSAPETYGPFSFTAVLFAGTNAYIVHAGTSRLYIASPSLPLYQVTRDSYFLNSNGSYRGIVRSLGGMQDPNNAMLDAMKLSLFPDDTLLLGTGRLWRTIPEATRDTLLSQFLDDPTQLCHQLITSAVNSHQENSRFFRLIVMGKKEVETETAAQLQHMQVIHMPEQLVLPKALQELQK